MLRNSINLSTEFSVSKFIDKVPSSSFPKSCHYFNTCYIVLVSYSLFSKVYLFRIWKNTDHILDTLLV